jgi:hypothetical protein
MITEFERIPGLFVELYRRQFEIWAREFRKRGKRCAIVFNPAPGAAPLFDGEGRIIAAGCWLEADIDRSQPQMPRVIIRPASEHDEEMIARHVKTMSRHVLQ